eukprot:3285472-Pleurochrysis_carterae.AAC.1
MHVRMHERMHVRAHERVHARVHVPLCAMCACACACPRVHVRVRAHMCVHAAVTLSCMKFEEGVVAVPVVELPKAEEKYVAHDAVHLHTASRTKDMESDCYQT